MNRIERAVHDRFKSRRLHGEWFKLSFDDQVELADDSGALRVPFHTQETSVITYRSWLQRKQRGLT